MAERKRVVPKRGEVYLVNFDPTIGVEIQKTRPALIIQNDIGNRISGLTIVAAISSQLAGKRYPFEVILRAPEGGLAVDSRVLLNQIRSIDKQRLIKRLGRLSATSMEQVDHALLISLGLTTLED